MDNNRNNTFNPIEATEFILDQELKVLEAGVSSNDIKKLLDAFEARRLKIAQNKRVAIATTAAHERIKLPAEELGVGRENDCFLLAVGCPNTPPYSEAVALRDAIYAVHKIMLSTDPSKFPDNIKDEFITFKQHLMDEYEHDTSVEIHNKVIQEGEFLSETYDESNRMLNRADIAIAAIILNRNILAVNSHGAVATFHANAISDDLKNALALKTAATPSGNPGTEPIYVRHAGGFHYRHYTAECVNTLTNIDQREALQIAAYEKDVPPSENDDPTIQQALQEVREANPRAIEQINVYFDRLKSKYNESRFDVPPVLPVSNPVRMSNTTSQSLPALLGELKNKFLKNNLKDTSLYDLIGLYITGLNIKNEHDQGRKKIFEDAINLINEQGVEAPSESLDADLKHFSNMTQKLTSALQTGTPGNNIIREKLNTAIRTQVGVSAIKSKIKSCNFHIAQQQSYLDENGALKNKYDIDAEKIALVSLNRDLDEATKKANVILETCMQFISQLGAKLNGPNANVQLRAILERNDITVLKPNGTSSTFKRHIFSTEDLANLKPPVPEDFHRTLTKVVLEAVLKVEPAQDKKPILVLPPTDNNVFKKLTPHGVATYNEALKSAQTLWDDKKKEIEIINASVKQQVSNMSTKAPTLSKQIVKLATMLDDVDKIETLEPMQRDLRPAPRQVTNLIPRKKN